MAMKENKSVLLCVSSSKSVSLYKDVVLRKKNNNIDNTATNLLLTLLFMKINAKIHSLS